MNSDEFLRHIEKDRDCEQSRLDTAVKKGLRRAKNDRVDSRKLLALAAACVFSFTMCIAVNLKPFEAAVESYYQSRQKIMPGASEALDGYINSIADNLYKYLGGE
jgi:hypothetical protein